MMQLKHAIEQWNGKSVEYLRDLYLVHHRNHQFVETLLDSLMASASQPGATWLIKTHLEQGHRLDAAGLCHHLPSLQHWTSRLHILQCIDKLDVATPDKWPLLQFIRENLRSDNKFVRAWAYSAFVSLAQPFPELSTEANRLVESAQQTEVPSVRARLRQLMQ